MGKFHNIKGHKEKQKGGWRKERDQEMDSYAHLHDQLTLHFIV